MKGHFIPLTLTCGAVLFDMDGTVVESTCVVQRAWGRWAKRHDIPLEAVLSFSHGRPTIATMEHFLPVRMRQRAKDGQPTLSSQPRRERIAHDGVRQFGFMRATRGHHKRRVTDVCDFAVV